MQFSINNRLKKISEMIRSNIVVIDVGADHGYLSIYLSKYTNTKKIIATDINPLPMNILKKNIQLQGVGNKIETILTNGLTNIPDYNNCDIVIAGMGGELIYKIIYQWPFSKDYNKNFILQPMSKDAFLRESLYKIGFNIISEKAVCDNNKIYSVMKVSYSGKNRNISIIEKYIGKISPSDKWGIDYILHKIKKLENICYKLQNIPSKYVKYKETKILIKLLYKIVNCEKEKEKV